MLMEDRDMPGFLLGYLLSGEGRNGNSEEGTENVQVALKAVGNVVQSSTDDYS